MPRALLLLATLALPTGCGDKDPDTGTPSTPDDTGDSTGSGTGDGGGDDTGEDCLDPVPWYYDADGDGFGDPDLTTSACTAPPGYVSEAEDCDDLRPDVHPGLEDTCNLVDDDCDGSIDEDAETSTWYPDLDADSHGDASAPVESCSAPDGYVDTATDCDDADDTIHPGAEETCGDDIDSDCDGQILVCLPEGEHDLDFESIHVDGLTPGDHLASGAHVADIDLDGVDDLLLSTTEGLSDSGWVYAWLGPITADTDTSAADLSVYGVSTDDKLGSAMLGGIDGDGDGQDDLILGAVEAEGSDSDSGAIYLFSGPVTGGAFSSDGADAVWTGYGTSRLGAALASGDFDGDGDDDVFIGTPNQITTAHTSAAAYLLQAPFDTSSSGILYTGVLTLAPDQKTLGAEALTGADFNGDGVDDLVVSDELYTATAEGVVYVQLGPITSTSYWTSDGLSVTGSSSDQLLGKTLTAGDLDGDGYEDVLAGATGHSSGSGAVFVLPGAASGMSSLGASPATIGTSIANAELGASLEITRDLDGDGLPEVLVGGPGEDDGAGTVWLFGSPLKGSLDVDTDADASFNTSDYDGVGSSLQLAEDLTGDGVPDIVVGAPTDQVGSEAGVGYVFSIDSGY